jgi:hypothetical protein
VQYAARSTFILHFLQVVSCESSLGAIAEGAAVAASTAASTSTAHLVQSVTGVVDAESEALVHRIIFVEWCHTLHHDVRAKHCALAQYR